MKLLLIILFFQIILNACNDQQSKQAAGSYPVLVTSDSLQIAYSVRGMGDTCLLFLHGWGIDQTYWDDQVAFFEKKYKVVTIDLAGFGKSDTGRLEYSMEQYANDVAGLINTLDLSNVILAGHSMGGVIMLEVALNYPDRIIGLAGIDNFKDSGHDLSGEERQEINNFFTMLRTDYANTAAAYAEGYLFHSSTDSVLKNKILHDIRSSNPFAGFSSLQHVFAYSAREQHQLKRLRLPLYLINSDATPTDEAALKKYCGNSYRLFTIPATGHFPMKERPVLFNSRMQDVIYLIGGHDYSL